MPRPNTKGVEAETSAAIAEGAPAAQPVAADGPPRDDRYALLIGIDDYPGEDADLPSGARDVAAMRDLLVDRFGYKPENVAVLLDRRATREAVRRAIRDHLGRAEGTALLYFSGHGVRLPGNVGRADGERDARDEAFYVWADDGAHSALVADDEVGAWLGELGARHVVAVLDACHSGTGARGSATTPPVKEVGLGDVDDLLDPGAPWRRPAAAPGRAVIVLAAAADRQLAFAGPDGEPSLFTGLLAEALTEADPATSLADVVRLVSRRVRVVARGYGGDQRPQLEGGAGLSVADIWQLSDRARPR